MTTTHLKLKEFIQKVRSCKTQAQERAIISRESAKIRTAFKDEKSEYRPRNLAKLLYIHMLGFPSAFGQMECLKLIVSENYSDKRVGYLGLMLLLDENQEVLMLVTNSLRKDLNHTNQYIVGIALCSLANICSESMARDVAPDIEKLLGSSNAYIRKKAALCAIRIIRKCPDLIERYVPKVKTLLSERNHGVLVTGLQLMTEICEKETSNVEQFRKAVPNLVRILKSLVLSGYAPEYDVGGVTDPFLQVKVIKLLRILGKGDTEASDEMADILAQVATNTDSVRNVGNAILYEAVMTIMEIKAEEGLKVLAINILGRFLVNRDNNLRYVALNTLSKVVNKNFSAVQRHRNIIVDCLKDPDISIRRRALDLVYALVNHSNVKALVRELLGYLLVADVELKADITAKLCMVTQKYAPNKQWHVDTILKVMSLAGRYIPEEVVSNVVSLISSNEEIQLYAVQKLYIATKKEPTKTPLVYVGVWSIGEFGDILIQGNQDLQVTEDEVLNLFESILKHPLTSLITKEYSLNALAKLSTKFSQSGVSIIKKFMKPFTQSIEAELQQRSCEYISILENTQINSLKDGLLKRMPPLESRNIDDNEEEEAEIEEEEEEQVTPQSQQQQVTQSRSTQQGSGSLIDLDNILGGTGSGQQTNNNVPSNTGGLNILDGILGLSTPPVNIVNTQPTSTGGGNLLEGIFGSNNNLTPVNPISQNTPLSSSPPIVAYDQNGLKIIFQFAPKEGNVVLLNLVSTNSTGVPITNFSVLMAVPPYVKLQMAMASGNEVPANGSGSVEQKVKLMNTLQGEKPILVKIKIDGQHGSQTISVVHQVNNFPQNI
eukprot:TRINITY_DN8439_c0_g1_i1.p1 TRINITY_DN8439_c0_g1~~TRINITY_DN8439_c0_g1_i1.p1  ORF type:complete len:831 (-),score=268.79 TRINITY_DN8439_c0_g1_i1:48-2540(-)